MTVQTITVQLPINVYERLSQRAIERKKHVQETVVELVTDALPPFGSVPHNLQRELKQMEQWSDDALWLSARVHVSDEKHEEMQWLVEKRQAEGLTRQEHEQATLLSQYFNRLMLIRAKSAAILKQRGFDVDILLDDVDETAV